MEILNVVQTCWNILRNEYSTANLPQPIAESLLGLKFPIMSQSRLNAIEREIFKKIKPPDEVFRIDVDSIKFTPKNFDNAVKLIKSNYDYASLYILHCFLLFYTNSNTFPSNFISKIVESLSSLIQNYPGKSLITKSTILSSFYYAAEVCINKEIDIMPLIFTQIDCITRSCEKLPEAFFALINKIAAKTFRNADEKKLPEKAQIFLPVVAALFSNEFSKIPTQIVESIALCIAPYFENCDSYAIEFVITVHKYYNTPVICELIEKLPFLFFNMIRNNNIVSPNIVQNLVKPEVLESLPEINVDTFESTFSETIQLPKFADRPILKINELNDQTIQKSIEIVANVFRSSLGEEYKRKINSWLQLAFDKMGSFESIDFFAALVRIILTVQGEEVPIELFNSPIFDPRINNTDSYKKYKNIYSLRAYCFVALLKSPSSNHKEVIEKFSLCPKMLEEIVTAIHDAIFKLNTVTDSIPKLINPLLITFLKLKRCTEIVNPARLKILALIKEMMENPKTAEILSKDMIFVAMISKASLEMYVCPVVAKLIAKEIVKEQSDDPFVREAISAMKIAVSVQEVCVPIVKEIPITAAEAVKANRGLVNPLREIFSSALMNLSTKERNNEEELLKEMINLISILKPENELDENESQDLESFIERKYKGDPNNKIFSMLLKLAAGNSEVRKESVFQIVHPRAFEVMLRTFKASKMFADVFTVLRNLIQNDGYNSTTILKSRIETEAFQIIESWRANPDIEPKISGAVKPPSEKVIDEAFGFIEALLCHTCTYGLMLRYIGFLCPVEGIFLPSYFSKAVETLENVFKFTDKKLPPLALPLVESTKIDLKGFPLKFLKQPNPSGVAIAFWVLPLSFDHSAYVPIFQMSDETGHNFTFSLHKNKAMFTVISSTVEKDEFDSGLVSNQWSLIKISVKPQGTKHFLFTYDCNGTKRTHNFSYFELNGDIDSGLSFSFSGSESPNTYIGPFLFFYPEDDIQPYIEDGPRSRKLEILPKSTFGAFVPELRKNLLFVYKMIDPPFKVSLQYKQQPIHTRFSMADVIKYHNNAQVLVPLLAQCDLKYQDGRECEATLFPRALNLIYESLRNSKDCQEAFVGNFSPIAHLFNTFPHFATSTNFEFLVHMLNGLELEKLKKELMETLIFNPSIWLTAESSVVNDVTKEWINIAKNYPKTVKRICNFSWMMGVFSCYLYYYKDSNCLNRSETIQDKDVSQYRHNITKMATIILKDPLKLEEVESIVAMIITSRDEKQKIKLLRFMFELLKVTKSAYKGKEQNLKPLLLLKYLMMTPDVKSPPLALQIFTEMLFTDQLNINDHFQIILRQMDDSFCTDVIRLKHFVSICKNKVPELLPICCWFASSLNSFEGYEALLTLTPDKKYCSNDFWFVWPVLVMKQMSNLLESQSPPQKKPFDQYTSIQTTSKPPIRPKYEGIPLPASPKRPKRALPTKVSSNDIPSMRPKPVLETKEEDSIIQRWAQFILKCNPSDWHNIYISVIVLAVAFEYEHRELIQQLLEEISKKLDKEFAPYQKEFEELLLMFLFYHKDEKSFLRTIVKNSYYNQKPRRRAFHGLGKRQMSGMLHVAQNMKFSPLMSKLISPDSPLGSPIASREMRPSEFVIATEKDMFNQSELEKSIDMLSSVKDKELKQSYGLLLKSNNGQKEIWVDFDFAKKMAPFTKGDTKTLLDSLISRYQNPRIASLSELQIESNVYNRLGNINEELILFWTTLNENNARISQIDKELPIDQVSSSFSLIAPVLINSFKAGIELQLTKREKAWSRLWHALCSERAPWNRSLEGTKRGQQFYKLDKVLCNGAPMKMRRNFQYVNHIEASVLRDSGEVKKAQEAKKNDENKERKPASALLQIEARSKEETPENTDVEFFNPIVLDCVRITVSKEVEYKFMCSKERIVLKQSEKGTIISIKYRDIREFLLRTVFHRRTAVEIFTKEGKTYFINFPMYDSATIPKMLAIYAPISVFQTKSFMQHWSGLGFTQKWVNGEISNFEYLLLLNKYSGRSFNNASQYPVFPWLLSSYDTDTLNLNDPSTFRDLSKPIGAIDDNRLKELRFKYNELIESPMDPMDPPYLYSSGPMSALTIYLYLLRVEPFTTLHIKLQSGRFDNPSRQFRSISISHRLAAGASMNDFSELIPEFFFMPEFLVNNNNFDLGKHDRISISEVVLPKWAKNYIDFIYLHRKILESDNVSANLHKWINLLFGIYQRSEEMNSIYKRFLYADVWDLPNAALYADLIEQTCLNLGQMPAPIFDAPHPEKRRKNSPACILPPGVDEKLYTDDFLMQKPSIVKPLTDILSSIIGVAGKSISIARLRSDGSTITTQLHLDKIIGAKAQPKSKPTRRQSTLPRVQHDPIDLISFSGSQRKPIWTSSPRYIYVTSLDRRMLLRFESGMRPELFYTHRTDITALAASERFLVVGDADGNATLFNVEAGVLVHVMTAQSFRERVTCAAISEPFHTFAAATKDGMLLMASINTRAVFRSIVTGRRPLELLITPSWGFVMMQAKAAGGSGRTLSAWTAAGHSIPTIVDVPFPVATAWTAITDSRGFDHIIFAEDSLVQMLQAFEAYYPEDRVRIPGTLECPVLALRNIPSAGVIGATLTNGSTLFVRFDVESYHSI